MAQNREVKSKNFIDENGTIDGSGTSGLIRSNNSKFEANIGDWVEYTDAAQALPEDGAGAVAADITLERTEFAAEILDGNGSMKITKANLADAQGQGVSLQIPVDKVFRAQPLKLEFDYNTAGTFVPANPADPATTPGDIGVYLYDVTNSKLLTPNQPYLTAASGRYEGLVQLPSDCEEVRVILHAQSTSTDLYVLFVDNVKLDIASNQTVENTSDWIDAGPVEFDATTTAPTKGSTITVDRVLYRIQGDSAQIKWEYRQTDAGGLGSGTYLLKVPSIIGEIDLNKISGSTNLAGNTEVYPTIAGDGGLATNVGGYHLTPHVYDATRISMVLDLKGTDSANYWSSTFVGLNAAVGITVMVTLPIKGRTSGTVHPASIGLNAKAIFRGVSGSATVTGSYSNVSFTTDQDTLNGWVTDTYTVKSPGYYDISANVIVGATFSAGQRIDAQIYDATNSTELAFDQETYPNTTAGTVNLSVTPVAKGVYLTYGQQINLRILGLGTGLALSSQSNFSIVKLGSEQQPYAPRIAHLKDVKTGTGGDYTTANVYQTRTLNTLEGDSNFVSLGNGTTGTDGTANQFTLQPGTYHIKASAPYYRLSNNKIKLRNITDASDTIIGTTEYSNPGADYASGRSELVGTFTIDSAKTFEIQHKGQAAQAANGLGSNTGFADNEVFTLVTLTKTL